MLCHVNALRLATNHAAARTSLELAVGIPAGISKFTRRRMTTAKVAADMTDITATLFLLHMLQIRSHSSRLLRLSGLPREWICEVESFFDQFNT